MAKYILIGIRWRALSRERIDPHYTCSFRSIATLMASPNPLTITIGLPPSPGIKASIHPFSIHPSSLHSRCPSSDNIKRIGSNKPYFTHFVRALPVRLSQGSVDDWNRFELPRLMHGYQFLKA